jgi:hypothetical protein
MSKKELKETKVQDEPTPEEKLTTEDVIVQVLDAYLKQEMGNKVTQFNVQGLMNLMLGAIAQNKQEG